jgi:hypothetical protein
MWRLRPLLWNNWVNAFPRKWIHAKIWDLFSVWSVPRVYKRTRKVVWVSWVLRRQPATIWDGNRGIEMRNWGISWELREILEKAIEWLRRHGKKGIRMWKKSSCVLQLQWDLYSLCVKIRCQESASGDCNKLRTLVDVTVNCIVWKSAIALCYLQLREMCISAINPIIQSKNPPKLVRTPKPW